MSLPVFFSKKIENNIAFLEADEAAHFSVLRKKIGDEVAVVDGNGLFFSGKILEIGKKSGSIQIVSEKKDPLARPFSLEIGIAPTKNLDRLEWFLEKSTEIGIEKISPIRCRRSERDSLRLDRCEKILVSAMKQSQRATLPKLAQLVDFQLFIKNNFPQQKFIAYCGGQNLPHFADVFSPKNDAVVLIGPEGDFHPDEIETAQKNGFVGISLGSARLRTETAALSVVHAFSLLSR
jgi:16S rRNA (uracil1498-N3)-methyltransferase